MTEGEKKQLITIIERGIILSLIIVIAVIMAWSSKQIKTRREAYFRSGAQEAAAPSREKENNAEFYFNEGLRLARAGRFEEAATALNKAIEINPSNYSAISNLGLVYKNMSLENKNPELLDKAMELYNKAININPNFADAYNNLGDAYFNQGKYAEAEKEFKECVRLDPLNINAHNNLGVALIMQNKKEEALEYWKQSLKINPDQPKVQDYILRNE